MIALGAVGNLQERLACATLHLGFRHLFSKEHITSRANSIIESACSHCPYCKIFMQRRITSHLTVGSGACTG